MTQPYNFISVSPGPVGKDWLNINIDLEQCLSDIYSSMFRIWKQWRDDHTVDYTEVDAISQCMLQMMMLKLKTLEQMLLGVTIKPNENDGIKILTPVRDKKVAKKVGNLRYFLYLYI